MDGEITGRTIPRRSLLGGAARGAAAIVTASALGPTVSLLGWRAAAQEATQVRLTGAPSSPEESRLLEQVLQDFAAKFPDITVVWEPVTQQYAEKLQTDLAAGTAADVFYVDSLLAPDLAARGVLLPLDEPMAEVWGHGRRLLRRPDRGIPMAREDLRPAEGLVEPGHGLRPAGV